MNVKAVVFPAQDQIEVREIRIADMREDQIRMETLYSFISPGTELRCLAGFYGADQYFPIIPGYSALGRVVEVGSRVKGIRKGDLLSFRHKSEVLSGETNFFGGQVSTHIFTPGREMVILPESAAEDPLPYAVTEVASISYRGVCLAAPAAGESVVVLGQGLIGSFSAEFFRMNGCRVIVGDMDDNRLKTAAENGFSCVDLKEDDALERILCFTDSQGFDIVSECSGTTAGFQMACKLLRKPKWIRSNRGIGDAVPRLLCQASYVEEIPIRPDIFFAGEQIRFLTPADRDPEDRIRVVELIRSGKLDPSNYVKNIFKSDRFTEAYRLLQKKEIISAVLDWQ